MEWALVPAAYLLGSAQFGLLIARLTIGRDVRELGSGKTGVTNVLRAAGKRAAALTLAAIAAAVAGGVVGKLCVTGVSSLD